MKDEMEQLYEAGLSPYEVLQTATSNPARFLGVSAAVGTVAKGKLADLVLLNADPLENIDNVFFREGIMLHGTWMPEEILQKDLTLAVRGAEGHPAN